MRVLFSLAGLLIVLAIVAMLAKTQLKAVLPPSSSVSGSSAAAAGGGAPPTGTVPEQSRQLQQQMRQNVESALQQGAARDAEPRP